MAPQTACLLLFWACPRVVKEDKRKQEQERGGPSLLLERQTQPYLLEGGPGSAYSERRALLLELKADPALTWLALSLSRASSYSTGRASLLLLDRPSLLLLDRRALLLPDRRTLLLLDRRRTLLLPDRRTDRLATYHWRLLNKTA